MVLLLSNVIFGSVCFYKKNIIDVATYQPCHEEGLVTPLRYISVTFRFYIIEQCKLFTVSTSKDCNVVAQYSNYKYIHHFEENCIKEIPCQLETQYAGEITLAEEDYCV